MFDSRTSQVQVMENATLETLMIPTTGNDSVVQTEIPAQSIIYWQSEVYYALFRYVTPLLWAFGTTGNVLTLAVLKSRHYAASTANVALAALAISDIGILNTGCLREWCRSLFSLDFRRMSTFACKIHIFLTYVFGQLSPLILSLITVERCCSVLYPLKVKEIVSSRRILYAIFGIAIFLCAVNSPFLIFWHIRPSGSCHLVPELEDIVNHYYIYWTDVLLTTIIPIITIFTGNAIIIVKLKKNRKAQAKLGTSGGSDSTAITVMLTTVGVVFLLLMTPFAIYWLTSNYWPVRTYNDLWNDALTYAFTMNLFYCNNSINFLLYCLSGTRFRQAFLNILCCRKQEQQGSSRSQSTNVSTVSKWGSLNNIRIAH